MKEKKLGLGATAWIVEKKKKPQPHSSTVGPGPFNESKLSLRPLMNRLVEEIQWKKKKSGLGAIGNP